MKQIIDPPLPRKKWRVTIGVPALLFLGVIWLIVFSIDSMTHGALDWARDWLERCFDRIGFWLNFPNRWPKQSRDQ